MTLNVCTIYVYFLHGQIFPTNYITLNEILNRFHKDKASDNVEKWTQLPINDLYKILEDLNVAKVLSERIDKRQKYFRQISYQQLKEECRKRNIISVGKKVSNL